MRIIYKIPGYILCLLGGFFLSWGGLIIRSFETNDIWQILLIRSFFFHDSTNNFFNFDL